jgi:hypothetical protein
MDPLLRDPAALHRKLRELGAGYLLMIDCCGLVLPAGDPEFQARFQRVYSDGVSQVFAVSSQ